MKIKNNILKHYLSNCYFVTGTAYAGKSTLCKAIAEKYNFHHCEENYNSDTIFRIINVEDQPNLSYFKTMKDWTEFLSRTPQAYESWLLGNNDELIGFEISELIRLSSKGKVIVDTNLPLDVLEEITDKSRVVILLSPAEISSSRFFDRNDPEKMFLLEQIQLCEDPDVVNNNFLEGIRLMNQNEYEKYFSSSFYTIHRGHGSWINEDETLTLVAKHFGLNT